MKLISNKIFLLILIGFSLAITAGPLSAQVYKVVDEDGNVTFTDQAPADGSQPVELRPISVIEAPTFETAPEETEENAEGGEDNEMSLRELRRHFQDFAIVAPQQEESIWNPEEAITVAWNARYQLMDGMQVTISLDGKKQSTTTEQIIPIIGLERGEHTVTAELRDARNRTVASAEPVTFFVRRPNIYSNRTRPTPRG